MSTTFGADESKKDEDVRSSVTRTISLDHPSQRSLSPKILLRMSESPQHTPPRLLQHPFLLNARLPLPARDTSHKLLFTDSNWPRDTFCSQSAQATRLVPIQYPFSGDPSRPSSGKITIPCTLTLGPLPDSKLFCSIRLAFPLGSALEPAC